MSERGRDAEAPEIRVERGGEDARGGGGSEGENGSGEKRDGSGTSGWEWAIAAVGALVVLSAVAFLLHDALTSPSTSPRIEIMVDSVVATEHGHVVEFRARNHGYRTAAGLLVEGEIRSDTGTVEKAEATIDYVPAQSSRRGGLLFEHDPRSYTLEIRGKGYDTP